MCGVGINKRAVPKEGPVLYSPIAHKQFLDSRVETLLPERQVFIAGGIGALGDKLPLAQSVNSEVDGTIEAVIGEGVQGVLTSGPILPNPKRQPGGLRVVGADSFTRIVQGVALPVADEDCLVTVHLS